MRMTALVLALMCCAGLPYSADASGVPKPLKALVTLLEGGNPAAAWQVGVHAPVLVKGNPRGDRAVFQPSILMRQRPQPLAPAVYKWTKQPRLWQRCRNWKQTLRRQHQQLRQMPWYRLVFALAVCGALLPPEGPALAAAVQAVAESTTSALAASAYKRRQVQQFNMAVQKTVGFVGISGVGYLVYRNTQKDMERENEAIRKEVERLQNLKSELQAIDAEVEKGADLAETLEKKLSKSNTTDADLAESLRSRLQEEKGEKPEEDESAGEGLKKLQESAKRVQDTDDESSKKPEKEEKEEAKPVAKKGSKKKMKKVDDEDEGDDLMAGILGRRS